MYGLKERIKLPNVKCRSKMPRTESIKSLRPEIPSLVLSDEMTEIERFQNEVLRPILKYQNEIILSFISQRINAKKSKFHSLIPIEKERHIDAVILKDKNIKQQLLGFVIGLFTLEEMDVYFDHESEYKRRINTMMRQRIVSQIESIQPK